MVRIAWLCLIIAGCSTPVVKPVIGAPTDAPWGWDNPIDGWCLRNPKDPNCPSL